MFWRTRCCLENRMRMSFEVRLGDRTLDSVGGDLARLGAEFTFLGIGLRMRTRDGGRRQSSLSCCPVKSTRLDRVVVFHHSSLVSVCPFLLRRVASQ
jgi:hypothetical protein